MYCMCNVTEMQIWPDKDVYTVEVNIPKNRQRQDIPRIR